MGPAPHLGEAAAGARLAAAALLRAEKAASFASLLGARYPDEALDRAWRLVLSAFFSQKGDGEPSVLDARAACQEALALAAGGDPGSRGLPRGARGHAQCDGRGRRPRRARRAECGRERLYRGLSCSDRAGLPSWRRPPGVRPDGPARSTPDRRSYGGGGHHLLPGVRAARHRLPDLPPGNQFQGASPIGGGGAGTGSAGGGASAGAGGDAASRLRAGDAGGGGGCGGGDETARQSPGRARTSDFSDAEHGLLLRLHGVAGSRSEAQLGFGFGLQQALDGQACGSASARSGARPGGLASPSAPQRRRSGGRNESGSR